MFKVSSSQINGSAVWWALLSILVILLGAAVAILGPTMGGAPYVVTGVAIIMVGTRMLRPLSYRIIRWLDERDA